MFVYLCRRVLVAGVERFAVRPSKTIMNGRRRTGTSFCWRAVVVPVGRVVFPTMFLLSAHALVGGAVRRRLTYPTEIP